MSGTEEKRIICKFLESIQKRKYCVSQSTIAAVSKYILQKYEFIKHLSYYN